MSKQYQSQLQKIQRKLFINGEYVQSCGGELFKVINPSTQEVIGQFLKATSQDVDKAVESAKKAFFSKDWRSINPHQRGRLLQRLANLIQQNSDLLAYFETVNNGKPFNLVKNSDIPSAVRIYRYFAGQADKIKGSMLPVASPFIGFTKKEPIGVVACIIAWNQPLAIMAWKFAQAIAAGCTVVFKPSELTPITALLFGQLFVKAGFPAGVINIITGFGETGEYLTQHKLVNKVSFTGSTNIGYQVMQNAHKHNLRPVTLQLGGKSANIILPDADLDEAAHQACILFSNCGQSCIAGSRTYVHRSIYKTFVEKCVAIANRIKVGDPFDPASQQGAIISRQQFEKILGYIEIGKKEGAVLAAGGVRVGEKGFFLRPTIFSGVKDSMRIAREEIFGPVMSILEWTDEEDVIERANALPFGLGAGVVTKNLDKMLKFTDRLVAGTVYVNCYDYQEACTPFGGLKDSGIGKDLGDEGLQGYLVTKTVIIKANL